MFKTLIVLFKVQSKKEPLLHFLFCAGNCCLGNTRCLIKVFPWCLFSLCFALAKTLSYGHKGDKWKMIGLGWKERILCTLCLPIRADNNYNCDKNCSTILIQLLITSDFTALQQTMFIGNMCGLQGVIQEFTSQHETSNVRTFCSSFILGTGNSHKGIQCGNKGRRVRKNQGCSMVQSLSLFISKVHLWAFNGRQVQWDFHLIDFTSLT